jgi:hypothetical protein
MDALIISSTPTTPRVLFDPKAGVFEIYGRSTPEHPAEYYDKLNRWIEQYLKTPCQITTVQIYLEYFNTSSSKYILEMLKKMTTVQQRGYAIVIQWYYEEEDEDMRESGIDFRDLLKVPFELLVREQV